MTLPNAKMNTVLHLSSRIFGRRAEEVLKMTQNACIQDQNAQIEIPPGSGNLQNVTISDIVIRYNGEHFSRNGNDIFLVFELQVCANVNGTLINTPSELSYQILASSSGNNNLTVVLSFIFNNFQIPGIPNIPIPMPNIPDIEIPLQNSFGRDMILVGEIEQTIVGGSNDYSPTLVLGIAINIGETVDRNHFNNNYLDTLLQSASDDWVIKIESNLMNIKIEEDFNSIDLSRVINLPNWARLINHEWRRAYWCGYGLSWDYKGWRDYVTDHFREHPIWLAGAPLIEITVDLGTIDLGFGKVDLGEIEIELPLYWLAWANILVDTQNEDLLLDLYIFEADARNAFSYAIPSITANPSPIRIDTARISPDFLITHVDFSPDYFLIFGTDEHIDLGEPQIEVPDEIGVTYTATSRLISSGQGLYMCRLHYNMGLLENGSVISFFEIQNRGDGPLWICSIRIDNDIDGLFNIDLPQSTPFIIESNDSIRIKAIMNDPGDNQWHTATLVVRSNNFNNPRHLIPINGIKMPEVSGADCVDSPWGINPLVIEAIRNLVIDSTKEDLERLKKESPIIIFQFDPEPLPCPECRYYLDICLTAPIENLVFQILENGKLVNQSYSIQNAHSFSIPLDYSGKNKVKVLMNPEEIHGKGVLKLGLSRISRVGHFEQKEEIYQLATYRGYVYTLKENEIDIINISDPKNPFVVSSIKTKKVNQFKFLNGNIIIGIDEFIEIFDVSDPYNPYSVHKIWFQGPSRFQVGKNHLFLYGAKKLRTYEISRGHRPLLVNELNLKTPIKELYRRKDSILLESNEGTYKIKIQNLLNQPIEPKFTPSSELSGKLTKPIVTKVTDQDHTFVLHDDFLLKVQNDKRGILIFHKDRIPYTFRKNVFKGIESLKKQKT